MRSASTDGAEKIRGEVLLMLEKMSKDNCKTKEDLLYEFTTYSKGGKEFKGKTDIFSLSCRQLEVVKNKIEQSVLKNGIL